MAEPVLHTKPMTFDEAALLRPDEHPGDLVDGEFVPVSRNTWLHGRIVFNVCLVIGAYTRRHPGWSVAAGDPGTKLKRDPDTLRGPDVAIASVDREPAGRGAAGWLEGAPEVAVEIQGDDQTMSELLEKALEYVSAGARQVWAVDPHAQRVVVITPPNQFRILGAQDVLEGGEVLPGFSCQVSEFFV